MSPQDFLHFLQFIFFITQRCPNTASGYLQLYTKNSEAHRWFSSYSG